MSVAVPRSLNVNTPMNPNITSRASTSTSSAGGGATAASSSRAGPSSGKVAIPSRPSMTSRTTSSASTATTASKTTSVAPLATGPGKDTSSSAGKVFAKPSKEWVLPERAKPGRKVCAEEPDDVSWIPPAFNPLLDCLPGSITDARSQKRQSQNRLSQRAHRARRTDYITTLEERLRQYEADEIHSNVRLQEVARALKTDNERMKNELMLVKGKMNELVAEREAWDMEKKGLEDMCGSLMSEVERLRSRAGDEAGGGLKLDPKRLTTTSSRHTHSHVPVSPPQVKRTGPTVACPICPDPDPDCPCQQPSNTKAPQQVPQTLSQPRETEISLSSSSSTSTVLETAPHQSDCGFCKTPAECLCRIINEPTPPKPVLPLSSPKGKCDVCSSLTVCLCEDDTPPPTQSTSIKPVPLPRASAAVPLSLRRNRNPLPSGTGAGEGIKRPLWRLDNVVKKGEAVCTGDPENCDACKNDDFGMSPPHIPYRFYFGILTGTLSVDS